jgi:hypothetical protein
MISKKAAIIYIVTANKQHRVSRRCDHTTIAQATAGTWYSKKYKQGGS